MNLRAYHELQLRRAVARLGTRPLSDKARRRLLDRLVRIWANPWSVDADLLDSMLHWLARTSGPVLECGSGVSTLVLVAGVSSTTRPVVSLEHEAKWAKRVWDAIPRDMRSQLDIVERPLVSHGDFEWYDVDASSLPEAIGFVLCDGPPGSTRGGRRGVTKVLRDRLAPGAVVLFDDTDRPGEWGLVQECCAELTADIIEDAPRHSVLRVPG